jgi:hypothetical protein
VNEIDRAFEAANEAIFALEEVISRDSNNTDRKEAFRLRHRLNLLRQKIRMNGVTP